MKKTIFIMCVLFVVSLQVAFAVGGVSVSEVFLSKSQCSSALVDGPIPNPVCNSKATVFDVGQKIYYCVMVKNGGSSAVNVKFSYFIDGNAKATESIPVYPGSGIGHGFAIRCYSDSSFLSAGSHTFKGSVSPSSGSSYSSASFDVRNPVQACVSRTWYKDSDGDGYGNPSLTRSGCDKPSGYVSNGNDCNDNDGSVHSAQTCRYNGNTCGSYSVCAASCPLPPREILCDRIDNDCNPATRDDGCGSGKTCDFSKKTCIADHVYETDISADMDNCGAVGNSCSNSQVCINGSCVNADNGYFVIPPEIFKALADEAKKEGNNAFLPASDGGEKANEKLLEQVGECIRSITNHSKDSGFGDLNEYYNGQFGNCLLIQEYNEKTAEFIRSSLKKIPSVYTAKTYSYVKKLEDGTILNVVLITPTKTPTLPTQLKSDITNKLGKYIKFFKIDDALLAKLDLVGMIISFEAGREQYNGSVMHAIMYVGENIVNNLELPADAADTVGDSVYAMGRVFYEKSNDPTTQLWRDYIIKELPEDNPLSFTELYYTIIQNGLIDGSHRGAGSVDVCIRENKVLECTAYNLVTIPSSVAFLGFVLSYPIPNVYNFSSGFVQEQGVNKSVYNIELVDTNFLPDHPLLYPSRFKLTIKTNQRDINEENVVRLLPSIKDVVVFPYKTQYILELQPGEYVITSTLTTYSGCDASGDNCRYSVYSSSLVGKSTNVLSVYSTPTIDTGQRSKTKSGLAIT